MAEATPNNRLQVFHCLAAAESPPFAPRLPICSQVQPPLARPRAVASVAHFMEEELWVADTGNNRVLLLQLPSAKPDAAWNAMRARLIAGDIPGALEYFATDARQDYRQIYLLMGTEELISVISDIPAISPIFVEGDKAQYYFEQVVDDQTITFPIEFVRENGLWKIEEY